MTPEQAAAVTKGDVLWTPGNSERARQVYVLSGGKLQLKFGSGPNVKYGWLMERKNLHSYHRTEEDAAQQILAEAQKAVPRVEAALAAAKARLARAEAYVWGLTKGAEAVE